MKENDVKKALHECVDGISCRDCLYDKKGCKQLFKDMLELLNSKDEEIEKLKEKDIPQKPIPIVDTRMKNRIISYKCPNCESSDLGNNEYRFDRCEYCGQALEWGE